jgi:hypothetical protein
VRRIKLIIEVTVKALRGKWLSLISGLPFLLPDETVDSFVEEMIPEAPTNERCSKRFIFFGSNFYNNFFFFSGK